MNATLYTGTGAAQTIINGAAGASFQPNMVWVKSRSATGDNRVQNSVAGVGNQLTTNNANAQNFDAATITALNSNGFSVTGSGASYNTNGTTYVGWQWKAGSSTVTNTAGSITSQVNANTTSGFSIVTYTGNGTTGATVGHGLGAAPQMIFIKQTNAADSWNCYHVSIGNGAAIFLNQAAAITTASSFWNNTTPSSTVITFGNAGTNQNNNVAYCWAPIAGYSAFGSYIGNGTQGAGPFVYTGFRPRYVLIKNINGAYNWHCYDSSRSPYNYSGSNILKPDTSDAELTGRNDVQIDILSNGFRLIGNDIAINQNSSTMMYAAFAENPFKYANAR
jgi:hypothetical protein